VTTTSRDLRTGRSMWQRGAGVAHGPLKRDVAADVLVIGAGITGAMSADALAQANRRAQLRILPAEREPVFLDCRYQGALVDPGSRAGLMATPDEMRQFAIECLRWAEEADDQSQFDLMLQCARSWVSIASAADPLSERAGTSMHGLHVQSEKRPARPRG
jgi:hypothetical protein